jgi:hypothetical protein
MHLFTRNVEIIFMFTTVSQYQKVEHSQLHWEDNTNSHTSLLVSSAVQQHAFTDNIRDLVDSRL